MSENSSKMSLTLKAGQGFDAPWLVIYPESVDEGVALLNEVAQKGLDMALANASQELQAKYTVAKAGLAPQQVSSAPVAPAQQAPAQQPPPLQFPQQGAQQPQQPAQQAAPAAQQGQACAHGAYIYKDFTSKAGRAIKGYFCPSQSRTDCKPLFVN